MNDSSKIKKELPSERQVTRSRKAKLKRLKQNVTEPGKAEDKLEAVLKREQQQQAEISAMLESSRAILECRDFEGAARAIFNSCKKLTGATAGYVALLSQDGTRNEVLFLDPGPLTCTVDPNLPMPIRGLRAKAYRSGKVVYNNEFSRSKFTKLLPEGHAELSNVLFSPLVIEGKAVGLMGLANKPTSFTEDDARMAMGFGEFAAIALQSSRRLQALQRSEADLQKAHHKLELRVEERTAELKEANEQLQHQITERKQAEDQLKASLKEKEVLVSEIHHRVKNNLQVISSLFKLQSEYIRDKRMLEMLKQSRNRVRAMALIHEKLYQSKDLVKIDFADYIRSLTVHLFRLYEVRSDAIALKIDAGDVSLGIDAAVPCGLIISELVSNSLKHAFPAGKKGQIRIEFHSDKDNHFTLIVSNNGVGLPKALDFRKAESLGLQLVNMLVGQLGGAIELDRSDGTTFKITFTEPQE